MTLSIRAFVAIAVILALAFVQMRGVGVGRVLQNSLTTLKVTALIAFAVIGFIVAGVSGGTAYSADAPIRVSGWLLALVPVMFSYTGWNAAVYVAEEIRQPVKNVPRALMIGTAVTVALYLALNALYLRVVPQEQFTGAMAVGEVAAERLFGSAAGLLFAVVAVVIILSSLSAMTTAGSARVLRHGSRRSLRAGGGSRAPAVPHARGCDRRAGGVELAARAVGDVRAAADVHGLRRDSVFGARRALAVLRAPHREAGGGRFARGAIRGRPRSSASSVSRSS